MKERNKEQLKEIDIIPKEVLVEPKSEYKNNKKEYVSTFDTQTSKRNSKATEKLMTLGLLTSSLIPSVVLAKDDLQVVENVVEGDIEEIVEDMEDNSLELVDNDLTKEETTIKTKPIKDLTVLDSVDKQAIGKEVKIVNVNRMKVRTGPGTNYSLAAYALRGVELKGTTQGNWFKTQINGDTVYLANKFLTDASDTKIMKMKNNNIKIRLAPIDGEVVGRAKRNEVFEGQLLGPWFRTKYNGKTVFIASQFMVEDKSTPPQSAGKNRVEATHGGVNIRTGAGTKYKIIGKTKKGQSFYGTSQGNWFKTTFNGKTAYISKKYLTAESRDTVVSGNNQETREINYAIVNIRSGPGTGYKILGQTQKGVRFTGVKEGSWFKTTHNGKTAYISYDLLKPIKTTNVNPPTVNSSEYTLTTSIGGFHTAADARDNKNRKQTMSAGKYYIYKTYDGMINISKTKGKAGAWINPAHNKTTTVNPPTVKTETKYATANFNIRSGASTKYPIIGRAQKGQKFEGTTQGKWFKTTYNGKTAYMSNSYLSNNKQTQNKPTENKPPAVKTVTRYVNTDVLNVRSGPGTNYSRLGNISRNTRIDGTVQGSWFKFKFNGRDAYVSTSYLTSKKPSVNSSLLPKLDRSKNYDRRKLNGKIGYTIKHTYGKRLDYPARINMGRHSDFIILGDGKYDDNVYDPALGRNVSYKANELYRIYFSYGEYHVPKKNVAIGSNTSWDNSAIKNMPLKYKKYVAGVAVSDFNKRHPDYEWAAGLAQADIIMLNKGYQHNLGVTYHEVGHAIDYAYGDISEEEPWLTIYNKEWKKQAHKGQSNGEYGAQSPVEAFAESFASYKGYTNNFWNKGIDLKNKFPLSFRYMQELDRQLD